MSVPFAFDPDDDAGNQRFIDGFEWDRSVVAFDGTQMVGTAGAFTLDMTVPGGDLVCGGTTVVTVSPTHRRQGVLRQMMDFHLDEIREHADPIAGLWASDSAIYGRFGYGAAARSADIEVDRNHVRFHRLSPEPSPVRMVAAADIGSLIRPFYEEVRRQYPGHYRRSDGWWERRRLRDDTKSRGGATAYRFAVSESNGVVTGYAQWRQKNDAGGDGVRVIVTELLGSDPGSWAGLWRLLLNQDLTSKIVAERRSLSDPLFELLDGRRRAESKVDDSLWIRIMDIPAALEGRRYRGRAATIAAVHDPASGTTRNWSIDVDVDGSEVTATDRSATVELDLEDLSGCFLGWSRFGALARAGRLSGDPDVLDALDVAFSWSPQPWCSEIF